MKAANGRYISPLAGEVRELREKLRDTELRLAQTIEQRDKTLRTELFLRSEINRSEKQLFAATADEIAGEAYRRTRAEPIGTD